MTTHQEPIAIIGFSCRFPGGATDPDKFWDILAEGRNVWSEVPLDRFNWKSYYHPSPENAGTTHSIGGHFLDQDIAAFDASFFGISPLEASAIDPQQRLQLESAYEALEASGLSLESIRGSNTGVYVATFSHDYEMIQYKDPSESAKYTITGVGTAIASNRISYLFDLKGPSMSIDTGCSGSMVALHQACQSLRCRESDMGLVGAANLILAPEVSSAMSNIHVLNKNGKCFVFDTRGEGYGRGEGAATLVLKRLDDALNAGDPIRAVIRSTAVGQDGKTNGITLPSSEAQEALIRTAYESAGLDFNETGFFEAHGTGTLAGDSAEIAAITRVFGTRQAHHPLQVGSVKGNIGHLENASGIAGVIKAILMLEKGLVPPTANLQRLKPKLKFDHNSIKIPTNMQIWADNQLRRVSVNSFGYGGTNAHTILEWKPRHLLFSKSRSGPRSMNGSRRSYSMDDRSVLPNGTSNYRSTNGRPKPNGMIKMERRPLKEHVNGTKRTNKPNGFYTNGFRKTSELKGTRTNGDANSNVAFQAEVTGGVLKNTGSFGQPEIPPAGEAVPRLIVLSAKSKKALLAMSDQLVDWISSRQKLDALFPQLASTLSSRRSIMSWRRTAVVSSLKELVAAFSQSRRTFKAPSMSPQITYVFTGQGAQWYAMGRELLFASSRFRDSIILSDIILKGLGADWSLVEELLREESTSQFQDSRFGQPASTSIQIALVDLMHDLGVKPSSVIGHSSGEIAAAYACAALTHEMALRVSFHRSFLAQRSKMLFSEKGAMLAVGLGDAEARERYAKHLGGESIVIACINSPSSITVSGDESGILDLQKDLDSAGVFNRRLKVDTAYHSHHMRVTSAEYLKSMLDLEALPADPSIKFFSSVTGKEETSGFDAPYWVLNLVSPVDFNGAFRSLCESHSEISQSQGLSPLNIFIEIGPHSALAGPIRQILTDLDLPTFEHQYVSSLVRNKSALSSILESAGTLFETGYPIDIGRAVYLSGSVPSQPIPNLPSYPWDHDSKFWNESRWNKETRLRTQPWHDLLGLRVPGSSILNASWRYLISAQSLPWLNDHNVDGFTVFPAASYMCMAIEAARQVHERSRSHEAICKYILKNVRFLEALVFPQPGAAVELQLTFSEVVEGDSNSSFQKRFTISSVSVSGDWTQHCHGTILLELTQKPDEVDGDRDTEFEALTQENFLSTTASNCSERLTFDEVYRELQSHGNLYGPNFALITDLRLGPQHTLSEVTVPDVAMSMPGGYIQPHVIHPTTLDSFIHSTLPSYFRQCTHGSVVTASVGEFTVSANVRTRPGDGLLVATEVIPESKSHVDAQISIFKGGFNRNEGLLAQMKNVVLRGIGKSSTQAELNSSEDMTYTINWNTDADALELPSKAVQIAEGQLTPEEKLRRLDQASAIYIKRCLESLQKSDIGDPKPENIAFYEWMERWIESDYARGLLDNISTDDYDKLIEIAQDTGVEGKMLHQVCSAFGDILRGYVDPLAVMLKDDLLYKLYADDSSSRCYAHMIEYLKKLSFKNPNLSVLEIGGGTGGATLALLSALSDGSSFPFGNYDFTDVSSGFFDKTREKLQKWEHFLQFKTLNIGQDPCDQGYSPGTYDVIIASNVLHVPRHVDQTLRSVRSLLKPGGKLLMIETIRVVPFYNALCGVLPGWWIGVNHGRRDSPLLTEEQWDRFLKDSSFEGIEKIGYDYDGPARRSAMLVSRAQEESRSSPRVTVQVFHNGLSESLSCCLVQRLEQGFNTHGCDIQILREFTDEVSEENVHLILDNGQKPLLQNSSELLFKRLTSLVTKGRKILWITSHSASSPGLPNSSLYLGFSRTARRENKNLNLVTLDVQFEEATSENFLQTISYIIKKSFIDNDPVEETELEYSYHKGQLQIARLEPSHATDKQIRRLVKGPEVEMAPFRQVRCPLKLHVESLGLLDTIRWVPDTDSQEALLPSEVEVQVEACGLNFKDVFLALGHLKPSVGMAGEYAGVVTKISGDFEGKLKIGDRVCGWGSRPYSSYARVNGHLATRIPDSMSFTTAVSIPVIFGTAYQALVEVARLEKGQTVLIHAASGGVGQAAVKIAQQIGAEIFATVGSLSKREFLMREFRIPEDHIFSSRRFLWKRAILKQTAGRGVDVVLNSLSGKALEESWACIAPFGTFVEIGKADIHAKNNLSMDTFDRNVTFASVDLALMGRLAPERVSRLLAKVMTLFETRIMEPVSPVTVMPIGEVESAFRLVQARKHVGKIVFEVKEDSMVPAILPSTPLKLSGNGTYIIAGGLGGLGYEICKWLAQHGARYVVLLSRRSMESTQQQTMQKEFSELGGIEVRAVRCNITSIADVEDMVSNGIKGMPAVSAVIQSAMVLNDKPIDQMTAADLAVPLETKVTGTQNLISALSQHATSLANFIMLSSVVSVTGNAAQANYAAGNAYLDALAHSPPASHPNTHFMSLNLGPMKDVGVVASNKKLEQYLVRQGYVPVSLAQFFVLLEYTLSGRARADSCNQLVIGFNRASLAQSDANADMLANPLFSHLPRPSTAGTTAGGSGAAGPKLSEQKQLAALVEDPKARTALAATLMARKVASLLALDADAVELESMSPRELGLDSLVVIELKNWIGEKLGASLPTTDILSANSFRALAIAALGKSGGA